MTNTYGWTITGDALSSSCSSPRSTENLEEETALVVEEGQIEGITLYPNPAREYFKLEIENYEGVWATLSNLSGKVLSAPVELHGNTTEFDLTGIKDRMLFLHLDKPDGSVTLRILRED